MIIFDPYALTLNPPNHLSFGGLDRDAINRENEECINLVLRNSETRILPLWRSRNLLSSAGEKEEVPIAVYLNTEDSAELIKISKIKVYLGKQIDGKNEIPYLAIDVSDLDEEMISRKMAFWGKFEDLREISPLLDGIDGSILAYARAIVFWHSQNGFCSVCGDVTISKKAGHQRNCTNLECSSIHFPRTDPAVIMLVNYRDQVLLGRQKIWPAGLYSTLAGFVEPGETIEHAVAREVYEESGILVKNITYQYSQPWPFPSSLMLGFLAEAYSKNIKLNDSEIEDAQWFTREEIINFDKSEKFLPKKLSVSRRLIEDWLKDL